MYFYCFNFSHECVETRMLTNANETRFKNHKRKKFARKVWMISRCSAEWVNETIKESCENKNLRNSLDLVVPVSDSLVNYRNKFCAFCNGVTTSQILTWEVEFYCDVDLSSRRKNIISAIKIYKCNLFFMPKFNMSVQLCRKRTTVQNSMGCVTTARGPIKQSCAVFKHPSTLTSICHYCNTTEHLKEVDEICHLDSYFDLDGRYLGGAAPPFFGILDLSALKTVAQTRRSCDPSTEFNDKIFVSIFRKLC